MPRSIFIHILLIKFLALALSACSNKAEQQTSPEDDSKTPAETNTASETSESDKKTWFKRLTETPAVQPETKEEKIWDLFKDTKPEQVTKVNQYIWRAALDVLDFLPLQTVDPFSGVIVTGYGKPPGGNRAYRATIFVSDPALDARSLKLSLQTKRGPVNLSTQRAIEDAILTRARQIRKAADRY